MPASCAPIHATSLTELLAYPKRGSTLWTIPNIYEVHQCRADNHVVPHSEAIWPGVTARRCRLTNRPFFCEATDTPDRLRFFTAVTYCTLWRHGKCDDQRSLTDDHGCDLTDAYCVWRGENSSFLFASRSRPCRVVKRWRGQGYKFISRIFAARLGLII